jgi:hypothetical protein
MLLSIIDPCFSRYLGPECFQWEGICGILPADYCGLAQLSSVRVL